MRYNKHHTNLCVSLAHARNPRSGKRVLSLKRQALA